MSERFVAFRSGLHALVVALSIVYLIGQIRGMGFVLSNARTFLRDLDGCRDRVFVLCRVGGCWP
jgi:hypothetical protein